MDTFGRDVPNSNVRPYMRAVLGWRDRLYWDIIQAQAQEDKADGKDEAWRHPTPGARGTAWEQPLKQK